MQSLNNNIDKFGRSNSQASESKECGIGRRGPPGLGFETDRKGNYVLKNKRLKLNNASLEAIENSEAVSLGLLRRYAIHERELDGVLVMDATNHVIRNVIDSFDPSSAVTRSYVDSRYPLSVKEHNRHTIVLCGNKRLASLADGIDEQDGCTLSQLDELCSLMKDDIIGEMKTIATEIKERFLTYPWTTGTPVAVPMTKKPSAEAVSSGGLFEKVPFLFWLPEDADNLRRLKEKVDERLSKL